MDLSNTVATIEQFAKYVPGSLESSYSVEGWCVPKLNVFSYGSVLKETPTPRLGFYNLALEFWGQGEHEVSCRINEKTVIDKRRSRTPSTLGLLAKGDSVAWEWNLTHKKPSDRFVSPIFSFDDDFLLETASDTLNRRPFEVALLAKPYFEDKFLFEIAKNLRLAVQDPQPANRVYAETCAKMLSVQLLKDHCTVSEAPKLYENGLRKHALKKVTEYVLQNLDQSIGLDDLASQLHMSSFHFARLFKQSTGKTPHQYLVEKRMLKAQELLRYSALPITEIAFDSGYRSLSSFSNAFKKFFKATPAVYRKSYQG